MSSVEPSATLMNPATVRARAKVLAREHRMMRAELVQLRRNAGLTQGDLAERMGVSQQAISKFERYDSDPKLSTVRTYANAVGALIEHRVERDHGQSIVIAGAKSDWVQMDMMRFLEIRSDHPRVDQVPLPCWSAATSMRTDFALAR